MDFSEYVFEQVNEKRSMLLWEYIKIGNMPGIRDSARHLFANYDSLDEFYEDLELGGIDFVQKGLGLVGKSTVSGDQYMDDYDEDASIVSVKAVEVYNTLIYFRDDLFSAVDYVKIKQLSTAVINICISTAVGKPYTSKSDFVSKLNNEFGDKVHLNFLSSVSSDCQFLIWSKEGSMTSKVEKVNRLNEKIMSKNGVNGVDSNTETIKIMTGQEFRDYLYAL